MASRQSSSQYLLSDDPFIWRIVLVFGTDDFLKRPNRSVEQLTQFIKGAIRPVFGDHFAAVAERFEPGGNWIFAWGQIARVSKEVNEYPDDRIIRTA